VAVRDQALLGGRGVGVNALRISWLYFRVGVMNELQYRVNFLVSLLQSAITLAVALAVLALVYSHTNELNGWTKPELLCVTGIQIFMGGIVKTYIQPNMNRVMDEVHRGTLDYALTKPEDAQVLASVREIRIWQVVDIVSGLIVLGFGLSGIATGVGPGDALAFAVALVFGAVLIYCFWLVIATGAFWVVNMWTAAELFDGIFATGRFPVGIYPGWLRYSVTFLVPVAFAVTVPAEAVTSRLDWETLVFAAVFAVVVFALTRWFWRFGLRRYSGASA
jgi:ABC-2 type transport system permease protein